MTKTLKLSTLALLLASGNLYAHHPAADIIDPDVYAMIEENISEVHLNMTFDDMGGDTTDVGNAMESREEMNSMADMQDASAAMEARAEMSSMADMQDVSAAMDSREEMSSMAAIEPAGSMNSQR